MSAANPLTDPEVDVPFSAVPDTIRELREKWAIEFTRANQLEHENETLRARVDAMRTRDLRNIDDLTNAHARLEEAYKEAIRWRDESIADWMNVAAGWQTDCENASKERDGLKLTVSNLRIQLAESRDANREHVETLRDVLKHDAVGRDCPDCGGTGRTMDEENVRDPGASHGFRTVDIEVDCYCYGGRVPR